MFCEVILAYEVRKKWHRTRLLSTCVNIAVRVREVSADACWNKKSVAGQSLNVRTCVSSFKSSRAWRIAEPSITVDEVQVQEGDQPALVELPDVVAEAIIEREELVLLDACKVGVHHRLFLCLRIVC